MWDPQDACSQAILPGGCRAAGHRAGGQGSQGLPVLGVSQMAAAPQVQRLLASHPPPLPGLLLREAIEDLEWTGGEVEFVLRRSPMRFALRSVKQQSLEVRCRWVESKSGGWVGKHLSP